MVVVGGCVGRWPLEERVVPVWLKVISGKHFIVGTWGEVDRCYWKETMSRRCRVVVERVATWCPCCSLDS